MPVIITKNMEIIEIKQLDNGVQKKPYADHIYHWNIKVSYAKEDDILSFCQTYLKSAKREEKDYWRMYRDNTLDFNEHMNVVCGGYYRLTRNDDYTWDYIVHYEYID